MNYGRQLVNVTTQNDIEVRSIWSACTFLFLILHSMLSSFMTALCQYHHEKTFSELPWFYLRSKYRSWRLDLTRFNISIFSPGLEPGKAGGGVFSKMGT